MKKELMIIALFAAILVSGCVSDIDEQPNNTSNPVSGGEPMPTECGEGSLEIILIDQETGEPITEGYDFTWTYIEGPCEDVSAGGQGNYNNIIIESVKAGKYGGSIIVKGYSNEMIEYVISPDSKKQITVYLKKGICQNSCSNETHAISELSRYLGYDLVNEYNVKCLECNLARGGYIKAELEKDGSPAELYYHWGWCSSGGTDCGWSLCISSDADYDLYESIKDTYCSKLVSNELNDSFCSEMGGYVGFDNSTAVRDACNAGEFEHLEIAEEDGRVTLSIAQSINRCWSRVSKGPDSCFDF